MQLNSEHKYNLDRVKVHSILVNLFFFSFKPALTEFLLQMREFYLNFKFRLAIFAVFWRLGFILNLDQLFL